MTERKFTDEEVIKALEHCTSSTTSEACNGCPFYDTDVCIEMDNALNIYALDLINRQRAELKALKMDNDQLQSDIVNATMNLESVQHELDKARAEIERLQKYNTDIAFKHYNDGIKEFAERLKERFFNYYEGLNENTSKNNYHGETLMFYEVADMIENCIENLVEEMTEGDQ